MERSPDANDATPVNISLIFVPRPPDLVEITKHKPTATLRRLLPHKLGKEVIFSVMRRWPIDPRDLEVPIITIVGVEDVHLRRQTELGYHYACNRNHRVVPQEENPTSCPQSRTLGKTAKTVTSNVSGVRLENIMQLGLL